MAALRPAAFACLLLASSAFVGTFAQDNATITADYPSILEAATASNLTTLLAVATGTVLEPSLGSTTFQGIVLAPTDAAFEKLNASLNGILGDLPPELVAQVLQYHVIATNESFPMLDNSTRSVLDTLLFGQVTPEEATGQLAFVPTGNETVPGQLYVGGIVPGALVDPAKSVTAGQARVYIIDEVLFPPIANVMNETFPLSVAGLANNTAEFSTLLTLVAGDSEVLELLSDPTAAYTIFAPNNDAFTDLLTTLNLDVTQLLPLIGSDTAKRVLKNHVLQGPPVTSVYVNEGAEFVVPTLSDLETDTVTIKNTGGVITIAGGGNTEPATLAQADEPAGLSVIHIIDKVLLPPDLDLTGGATPAPAAAPTP